MQVCAQLGNRIAQRSDHNFIDCMELSQLQKTSLLRCTKPKSTHKMTYYNTVFSTASFLLPSHLPSVSWQIEKNEDSLPFDNQH